VKLRHRLVRRMPGRMLESARDIGLSLDGHTWNVPGRCDRSPDRATAKSGVTTERFAGGHDAWSWA
jgi:hypothetical protein